MAIQYLKHLLLWLNQNCFVLDLLKNVEHCANLIVLGKTLELFISKSTIVFIPMVNKPRQSGHWWNTWTSHSPQRGDAETRQVSLCRPSEVSLLSETSGCSLIFVMTQLVNKYLGTKPGACQHCPCYNLLFKIQSSIIFHIKPVQRKWPRRCLISFFGFSVMSPR